MDDNEIHTQFQVLRRPTAKCDACDEKGNAMISKCNRCVKQFCNKCLNKGKSPGHARSAEDAALAAAEEEKAIIILAKSKEKLKEAKLRKAEKSKLADEIKNVEKKAPLGDSSAKPRMGTFGPSPQKTKRSSHAPTPSESSVSPGLETSTAVHIDHTGTDATSSTSFGKILLRPWNRPSATLGANEYVADAGSDTESDGVESDHQAANGAPYKDERYEAGHAKRPPDESPTKSIAAPRPSLPSKSIGDAVPLQLRSQDNKGFAAGAAQLLRKRLQIKFHNSEITAPVSNAADVPTTPNPARHNGYGSEVNRTLARQLSQNSSLGDPMDLDDDAVPEQSTYIHPEPPVRFSIRSATANTLNRELREEMAQQHKDIQSHGVPIQDSSDTNTDPDIEESSASERRAPAMASHTTKKLFASKNRSKFDGYGIDLILAAAAQLDKMDGVQQ